MVIQFVKFKPGKPDGDVLRIMQERAPQFRAVPGLLQKYWGRDRETGEFCGIYFWDSAASMQAYRQSELARSIPIAYEVQGPPRAEFFDHVLTLRPEKGIGDG